MISLVIFSAVILGLAGLAFQVAKRGTQATDQALMMSTLLARVDRASMTPFESLSVIAGCDTVTSGTMKIMSCTRVTSISTRIDSILVAVQTTVPGTRPDTVTLRRVKNTSPVPMR